jgi:hypothetical protein
LTRFRTRWKRLLSRRPPSFIVTAGVVKVELDDSGAARAPFTVTNSSAAREAEAEAEIVLTGLRGPPARRL